MRFRYSIKGDYRVDAFYRQNKEEFFAENILSLKEVKDLKNGKIQEKRGNGK